MSDLVKRLRSVSGCTQKTFLHSLDWEDGRKIITEAADRIEALEAALMTEWAARDNRIETLEAEVARLNSIIKEQNK